MRALKTFAVIASCLSVSSVAVAQAPPGEEPALGSVRIDQADIESGSFTLSELRREGRRIFSTPFNKLDGFGDGPFDTFAPDPTSPGNRPTLQNNGTFLRINGLDAQTCLECHSVASNRVIPATFAVGGVAGIGGSAMPDATDIDLDDSDGNGFASFNGRLINPPFVFSAGGIELIAKEMTARLQQLKSIAEANPGTVVDLRAKGVSFGTLVHDGNDFDFSNVEGIDDDLVVKPFGRKGNNETVRVFDLSAFPFHMGIEPEEVADDMDGDGAPDPGVDNDPDGDGVFNELTAGELSAVHVFSVALEHPTVRGNHTPAANAGRQLFNAIGCTECHVPSMVTNTRILPLQFPELHTDPFNQDNVYFELDLGAMPARFPLAGNGVRVGMFSDFKRHDMGPELAESTGGELDPFFITARLWGVADTAPYLHDGRAFTLTEAIELHGGEGAAAATAFSNLSDLEKTQLLTFLRTLRTPPVVGAGLQQTN